MKNIRASVANIIERVTWTALKHTREDRNVDIALAALVQGEAFKTSDVVAYVDFLRKCIEPTWCSLVTVRADDPLDDAPGLRFQTLLQSVRGNLPPVPVALAMEVARAADELRSTTTPLDAPHWSGDVGLHFAMASSLGRKGRLLSSIVRFCRPKVCLELGTAYGMSARFILGAQDQGPAIHLTTIECDQPTYQLMRPQLITKYGAAVDCRFGMTADVLPQLVKSIGPVDFVFHDAGHSERDYIRDFSLMVDALAPGAVMLIDDIRWEDPRWHEGPANTYRGWQSIVRHGRVRHAAEIDGSMGLVLLS